MHTPCHRSQGLQTRRKSSLARAGGNFANLARGLPMFNGSLTKWSGCMKRFLVVLCGALSTGGVFACGNAETRERPQVQEVTPPPPPALAPRDSTADSLRINHR